MTIAEEFSNNARYVHKYIYIYFKITGFSWPAMAGNANST